MKAKKFLYSQKVAPYVFVLPFIISFIVFWIYPLVSTVTMSFQSILPGQTEFIGLENYSKLFRDKAFRIAIKNSFTYMVWTLVLLIPFPMLFAVLVDSNLVKASGFWKAVLYMPSLTSVVISGILFRLMFSEYPTSQMNKLLVFFGQEPMAWLKNGTTGMFALLLLACWRWTGVNMLYFLSGLKGIDASSMNPPRLTAPTDGKIPIHNHSSFKTHHDLCADHQRVCRTGNVLGVLHVMGGKFFAEEYRPDHCGLSV